MERGRHPPGEAREVAEHAEGGPSISKAARELRGHTAYAQVVQRLQIEVERLDDALKALPTPEHLLPGDNPWMDLAAVEFELTKMRVKLDQLVDSLP